MKANLAKRTIPLRPLADMLIPNDYLFKTNNPDHVD